MNYKVARTMLVLCIVYLVSFYILKFFFPELLLQTITNPSILRLGEFMDSHKVFEFIFKTLSSFIAIYLFACASSGRFKFNWLEFVYIFSGTALMIICELFFINFYTHTATAIMFLVAMLCKGKLKYSAISFAIHGYLSMFLFQIKGFETIILQINNISGFMLGLEVDFWLILLAIIFNIKERKENGRMGSPISKQTN